jgi:type VI protein secretion system component VasK
LIAQARSSIRRASIPQIMYARLQRSYRDDETNALRLDVLAGVGIEKVLRRRSGRKLSEPVPAIYTQKVFKEVTGPGMVPLVKQFSDEEWVWGGGGGVAAANWSRLTAQLTDIYERDYANAWDGLLNDLEIVQFRDVQQYADALGVLTGPTSPLRGVLKVASDNTSLVTAPGNAAASQSIGSRITEGARDLFSRRLPARLRPERWSPIASSRSTACCRVRRRRSTASSTRSAKFASRCLAWRPSLAAPSRSVRLPIRACATCGARSTRTR